MMQSPLSMLLTAALATAVLPIALAQQTTSKQTTKSGQTNAAPPKTPPNPAPAPAPSLDNEVVGVVNSKTFTWGQLMARVKQDQPQMLPALVGQLIAGKAAAAFFGPTPKDSFTITRAEALSELRKHPSKPLSDELDLMLNEEAVNQQATKEGVNPTDQDLDALIAQALGQIRGKDPSFPPGMSDDQFLESKKMSRQKVRDNFRTRAKVMKLIEKDMARQLGHPFQPDDLIQASHVLIEVKDSPPDAKPEEKQKADAAALARINAIAEAIKSGKTTFEQAARENSEDPGSKGQGGDLGMFMRGTMVKDFENAAFSAKTGVMTAPVRSQFGYHLILVTKRGTDMLAKDRQAFLDDYETKQIPVYLVKLTGQMNKVENRLAPLVPPQPGVGMVPGR